MTTTIHRAARHALADDPWMAEKVAKAVEVFERLRVASWRGRRANRAPQGRESTARALGQGGESNG